MTGVVPCYKSAMAVSILCTRLAARPALLTEDVNNKKDRWSRHGLGHPLNRADPEASDRNWTATVWEMIIRKGCGLKTAVPKFVHLPAVGRTTNLRLSDTFPKTASRRPLARWRPVSFRSDSVADSAEECRNGADDDSVELGRGVEEEMRCRAGGTKLVLYVQCPVNRNRKLLMHQTSLQI